MGTQRTPRTPYTMHTRTPKQQNPLRGWDPGYVAAMVAARMSSAAGA